MSKFLLGVAVGYIFHGTIDKAIRQADTAFEKKVDQSEVAPTVPTEKEVSPS